MIDTRDPRGIVNFFVRYLVLHVIFLVGLSLSYAMGLALFYFFGFIGFFTFFQVLIAVTRKFLDKAGWWKPVAIAGAVLSDVAVLWWLGGMLGGALDGSSEWWLVTAWLPYHFVAAFFAWGLREFFRWLSPRLTATPSASDTPTDPAETKNISESEDTEADTPTATTGVTEADTDTDTDKQ
ncbi:MAG: protein CrcB-like protein [Actinomyces sp.]